MSPKTGRTHQIRVHLASIGHPIVGDMLYGGKRARRGAVATAKECPPARLMLHATELAFTDSDGSRFAFEAPLPDGFSVIHRAAGVE